MSKLLTCTKCKKKKQSFEFHKRSGRPKGFTSQCKKCIADSDKIYRDNNSDRLLKQKDVYRKSNSDAIKEKSKLHRLQNLEFYRERDRKYYSEHKERTKASKNFTSATRYAKKLEAQPEWLSSVDISKIKSLYKMSRNISKKTGTQHHVDHIVPLVNDRVCGLHVPWNLRIIPATENLSKSNRIIEDIV